MNRPTVSVLLSALVIPGAGHLYLKRIGRGIVLIVVSLVCLWFVLDQALQEATAVMDEIQATGLVDPARISDLMARASSAPVHPLTTLATVVLGVCWVFGIVDAWRLGRRAG